MLYLIEILHQTTTAGIAQPATFELYLIEILHQTTTKRSRTRDRSRCILSKFYIKPQPIGHKGVQVCVVSYRNSTSNHNFKPFTKYVLLLYLIEILHQTTTQARTTILVNRCILSKFYIKPQRAKTPSGGRTVVSYRNSTSNHNGLSQRISVDKVVSYRNSTSNHNYRRVISVRTSVVSYRNSTSNHNSRCPGIGVETVVSYRNSTSNHNGVNATMSGGSVVSYRNSTSNHNCLHRRHWRPQLYLIEILHQTTTSRAAN